jgi:8-oxo-dGTP diphosphatase
MGAAALIEDGDRIALVRRAHEPYRGWWTMPAGFVEYGEEASETAVREAEEETGLTVSLAGVFGVYFGAGDPRGAAHLVVYRAHRVAGELRAADDADEACWFRAEELPAEIAFEAHRQALAEWLEGRNDARAAMGLRRYAMAGPAAPLLVYAIIENPCGSSERIVYDAAAHDFRSTGAHFPEPIPMHYGWIPATLNVADGEELDVAVLGEGEAAVGSVLPVRPIGTLLRDDGDHKVVAARVDCPSIYAATASVTEIPKLEATISRFFQTAASVTGWLEAQATRQLIVEAQRVWALRHAEGG